MRSGIYMITCIVSGKSYIGKTIGNIRQRVVYHLNGNAPGCAALHSAIKKYGKENFTWQVLHENVIPDLLSMFEMEAIKTYDTISPVGYNLTAGGETGFQSEETIRKRTETLRANPPMKGRRHTPESCQKMSLSRTGSKRSPETRKRQSEAAMGHSCSSETRQKIAQANRLPEKDDAYKFYLSLSSEMPRREKVKILSAKFVNVKPKTINYWMSEWEPHKSQTEIMKNAHTVYCSLPDAMKISDKRNILKSNFCKDVHPKTVNGWVRKWQSEIK